MTQSQELRDHPAHRQPDDVGSLDAQVVEQAGGVSGHVVELIGCSAGAEQKPEQVRHSARLEDGGKACVAVVVADDLVAVRGEDGAKAVVPADQLRAEAADEQEGLALAHRLVLDVDLPELRSRHDPRTLTSGGAGYAACAGASRSMARA
jgi:hypothetical protein